MWDFDFFFNNILLGVGLAMDAFSVSLADGMNEQCIKSKKMAGIAALFAVFQGVMPFIGWVCVHTVVEHFKACEKFIPYIALILLVYIGVKMIYDGKKCEGEACECKQIGFYALLLQGIATSIDALSVGFTIAEYGIVEAVVAALLIAAVTFFICLGGVALGKKFGTVFAGKANIFGGIILIVIGIEIFLKGIL